MRAPALAEAYERKEPAVVSWSGHAAGLLVCLFLYPQLQTSLLHRPPPCDPFVTFRFYSLHRCRTPVSNSSAVSLQWCVSEVNTSLRCWYSAIYKHGFMNQ
jgi:hypothetical protein